MITIRKVQAVLTVIILVMVSFTFGYIISEKKLYYQLSTGKVGHDCLR